jgi:hypothetical protein
MVPASATPVRQRKYLNLIGGIGRDIAIVWSD